MRIAILTLPLHTNYGGILQCYALQTILQRMGHDVKVLTKPQYGSSYYWIYPLAICKRIVKRYILGKDIDILKAPHELLRKNTDRFIRRYIKIYSCRNWTPEIAKRFDAIVVGSDQIWRPEYSYSIENSFLSFLGNSKIKRISYAASFGVDSCEYTEEQLKVCSSFLKKFDAVSVRETSGIKICHDYFDVDAVQMLDPTLLLSADDYRVLINNAVTKPSKGNMLVYIIDITKEKKELVNRLAAEYGLIPFWLDSPDEYDENLPLDMQIKMPVEQWLRSFDDAEFVLTDSFHGCVFSVIFRKQFLTIGNKERGMSRFYSFLKMLSIENRMILLTDEFKTNISLIDYSIVYDKLFFFQKQSIDFLNTNVRV